MKDIKTGRFITKQSAKQHYLDSDWLKRKYSKEKLTIKQIAKYCNVDYSTIHKQLQKFNISIRPNYQRFLDNPRPYMDREWLYNLYIVERQSISYIAKESGNCLMTIHKWLTKHNIPIRDGSECRTGNLNPRFKGSYVSYGYKYIYNPEVAKLHNRKCLKGNYIQEHILVMSEHIGRPVEKSEIVHHKDGNRLNNDISNLQLFSSNSEHIKYEQLLNTFIKQCLFSDLLDKPFIKKYLNKLLDKFVNGQ